MNNPKAIVYDLAISIGAISLWLVPIDEVRAIGYATSLVFSGRGYVTGVILLSNERKSDEVEAMQYDATIDFHERLLESSLELKLQQLENRFTEFMIPLVAQKVELDKQMNREIAISEITEADKKAAVKEAIDSAFDTDEESDNGSDNDTKVSEEEIRKQFAEVSDSANWKAILKALQTGATKAEIIKDVLQCRIDIGNAYIDLLKRKFFD